MDAPTPDPLDRRGLLIVSLPRNDAALARAAAEAGADMLKVHVNVHHRASGTRFGSLDEEEEALSAVLAAGLPTGLVPGRRGHGHARGDPAAAAVCVPRRLPHAAARVSL